MVSKADYNFDHPDHQKSVSEISLPLAFDVIDITQEFELNKEFISTAAVKAYSHRWGMFRGAYVFCKHRKKHNRNHSEVASHQFFADELKPVFGLPKIGTQLVWHDQFGPGIMQLWRDNLGTVKMPHTMALWKDKPEARESLFRLCFFDAITGGLDRHGNNVLVLPDVSLVAIDDEDIFYEDRDRRIIKFDKNVRALVVESVDIESQHEWARSVAVDRRDEVEAIAERVGKISGWTSKWSKILRSNLDDWEYWFQRVLKELKD